MPLTQAAVAAHSSLTAGSGHVAVASPRGTVSQATASLNAWIEVDLNAVAANVAMLREAVGNEVELIAVVKANAYGAGVAGLAPALEQAGVERFAVVWASEGVALRAFGTQRPILVLGHAFPADAAAAVASRLTLTVDTLALGEALSREAVAAGTQLPVHIHIDSGLHRDGLAPEAAVQLADTLRALPGIVVEGVSTHMANADELDDSFSAVQQKLFRSALNGLDWVPYRHTANSATALRRTGYRFDGVRLGLALHGILPENTPALPLQPILSLKARVARIVDVPEGEGVSYGLTWHADRPSRAALIPVGYADGWRRSLGNAGEVLIGGRRCPMIGRVCMDQFLVDVTDLPNAAVGDEAVLLGSQGSERISAEFVAARTGTIPWEVFAALQARLPRIFHRDGRVETISSESPQRALLPPSTV